MLELLCAIPEEIGWVIVGATGMLTFGVFLQGIFIPLVGRPIVESIKDWWRARKEIAEFERETAE